MICLERAMYTRDQPEGGVMRESRGQLELRCMKTIPQLLKGEVGWGWDGGMCILFLAVT